MLPPGWLPEWSSLFGWLAIWAAATPLLVFVGSWAASLALHGLLLLFRAGDGGWRATFRVVNYVGGAANTLLAIPFAGFLAAPWGFGCAVAGLASAHGASRGRVVAAIMTGGLAVLLAVVGCLVLVALAFATRVLA